MKPTHSEGESLFCIHMCKSPSSLSSTSLKEMYEIERCAQNLSLFPLKPVTFSGFNWFWHLKKQVLDSETLMIHPCGSVNSFKSTFLSFFLFNPQNILKPRDTHIIIPFLKEGKVRHPDAQQLAHSHLANSGANFYYIQPLI